MRNEKWWPADWSFRGLRLRASPVRRSSGLWSWERWRRCWPETCAAGAGPARMPPLPVPMTTLDCKSPAAAALRLSPAATSVSACPITFYGTSTFLKSLEEFEKSIALMQTVFIEKVPKVICIKSKKKTWWSKLSFTRGTCFFFLWWSSSVKCRNQKVGLHMNKICFRTSRGTAMLRNIVACTRRWTLNDFLKKLEVYFVLFQVNH